MMPYGAGGVIAYPERGKAVFCIPYLVDFMMQKGAVSGAVEMIRRRQRAAVERARYRRSSVKAGQYGSVRTPLASPMTADAAQDEGACNGIGPCVNRASRQGEADEAFE